MAIPLDDTRTCTTGIRTHRASDYNMRAGTPRVSRNIYFRRSPASYSLVKQSCMKHSNSYLQDRDVRHLQGPPLRRTKRVIKKTNDRADSMREKSAVCMCVCVCVCVCVCACVCVTGTLKHVKSSVARSGGIVLRWSSG